MAAGVLQAPGTHAGPCVDPCDHRDCRAVRHTAEAPCDICGKPVGYNRRFYKDPAALENFTDMSGGTFRLTHAMCLEEQETPYPREAVG